VFSHQRSGDKEKKKESGDSSENGFCTCGLPACCCQPAVAGGVIYADLWGELSTHWPPPCRLCLLRFLLCMSLCYKFSPFQALGKVTLHPRSQACGALLVSPFNVKWRFSVPSGGVEGSKLCLFSVFMPATCVSSFSPRFHYRRLAFCFLPLAAILESLSLGHFVKVKGIVMLYNKMR
jgi:hypothetical protein